jgi:hypothetical protein
MSSCEQFSAFHARLSVLLAFLTLAGCTHDWDADGGAAWRAQQAAEAQAQQDAYYRQQAARADAQEQAFCERNAGPVGTQPYADCRWQITMRQLTVMGTALQMIPQPQPATITPFSCAPSPLSGGVSCF